MAVRAGEDWLVSGPARVPVDLLGHLRSVAGGGAVVLGVDAVIGVPVAYGRQVEAENFLALLAGLGSDDAFFRVCDRLDEVTLSRPFFPRGVGAGPRRQAHAARLGMSGAAMLRRCDEKTADRAQAAALFWTLGANQVGKAALSFWREVLLPSLAGPARPVLWPFAGRLHDVIRPGTVVIAETYPAETLYQLGLRLAGSKRRQGDRAALAPALSDRLARLRATPDPALAGAVAAGFGADAFGEDRFDSLVGLLGLLHVLADPARDVVPDDREVLRWEGWILGQRNEAAIGAPSSGFLPPPFRCIVRNG